MTILGIPDIAILEPVDIHIEATMIIEVDVGDEERNIR